MREIAEELKIEKPEFLYHGSRNREIEELEPRRGSYRDSDEGELVFATPDLALAVIFMSGSSHYIGSGKFNDVAYVWIVDDRENYISRDKGGHVYVLSSDTFECDPGKGLGEYEWTSKEGVKPVRTLDYSSSLDAMVENGVQVYFVDKKTQDEIEVSRDHGREILMKLESENQRRGANVKTL